MTSLSSCAAYRDPREQHNRCVLYIYLEIICLLSLILSKLYAKALCAPYTAKVFAVLTHSMNAKRLLQLRHRLHCEMHTRVGVFVSELDGVIRPRCSYALRDALRPHTFVVFERCGHNVADELPERFCNELLLHWRAAEEPRNEKAHMVRCCVCVGN